MCLLSLFQYTDNSVKAYLLKLKLFSGMNNFFRVCENPKHNQVCVGSNLPKAREMVKETGGKSTNLPF